MRHFDISRGGEMSLLVCPITQHWSRAVPGIQMGLSASSSSSNQDKALSLRCRHGCINCDQQSSIKCNFIDILVYLNNFSDQAILLIDILLH